MGSEMCIRDRGNSSHGYFAADEYSVTSIDRVDYSNDTATASPKGNLSFAFGYGGGCSSRANALPIIGSTVSEFTNIVTRQYLPSSQRGYFTGGSPSNTSIINRIEFANDTARATLRGFITVETQWSGATGNVDYGYVSGGGQPSPIYSTTNRVDYSNDTATALAKGPLATARKWLAAAGNKDYGWYAGGNTGSDVSTVERLDFGNDTCLLYTSDAADE